MTEAHVGAADLAGYFRGLLDEEEARALEEHCAGCDRCATELQTEARVEVALHEVAAAVAAGRARATTVSPVRPLRRGAQVGLALATAAAVAFGVTRAVPFIAARPTGMTEETAITKESPPMRVATAAASAVSILAVSAASASCAAPPCAATVAPSPTATSTTSAPRRAAAPVLATSALDASAPDTHLSLRAGEIKRIHVGAVAAFHLQPPGVVSVVFDGEDVLFEPDTAGKAAAITLVAADGTATRYDVDVLPSVGIALDLKVGDVKTLKMAGVTAFHVTHDGVASFNFVNDVLTVVGDSVGTTVVTFVSAQGKQTEYLVHVSGS